VDLLKKKKLSQKSLNRVLNVFFKPRLLEQPLLEFKRNALLINQQKPKIFTACPDNKIQKTD